MGEANRKSEEKKKKFEETPGEFTHNEDVIMAVKFEDGKVEMLLNPNHVNHFPQALGLLVLEAPVFRNFVKAEQRQRESGIITPGGNGKGRFKA